jgi:hypothetical protein
MKTIKPTHLETFRGGCRKYFKYLRNRRASDLAIKAPDFLIHEK